MFEFNESDFPLDRSLSPISPDPVLSIHLDSFDPLTSQYPMFPHSSHLLLPPELAENTESALSTERVEVVDSLLSPRTLFQHTGDPFIPRIEAKEIRLKSEINSLKERIKDMEDTVDNTKSAVLVQEIRRLERENAALRQNIQRREENREKIVTEIQELRTVNSVLSAKLEEKTIKVEKLKSELNFGLMDGLGKDVDFLRKENEMLRNKTKSMSDELLAAKEHIKFLEIELLEHEAGRIEVERMQETQKYAAESQIQEIKRRNLEETTMEMRQNMAKLFDAGKMTEEISVLERKKAEVRSI